MHKSMVAVAHTNQTKQWTVFSSRQARKNNEQKKLSGGRM